MRRIPQLDGLRVLLVFIVSWYHFWQQSWLTPSVGNVSLDFLVRSGYMHVDGTILLSGFLLFLPYARSMLLDEPLPDRRWFYRRRIMRIVPSFYFVTLLMLFAVAVPFALYASPQTMVKDVFMHLTFTFTFDPYTYISTPIGVASWTLAIEMQAYLLFPLMARAFMRKPWWTFAGLSAAAWLWRGWCLWALNDYNMVVNQLPSFLDVYALGMAGAAAYVALTRLWKRVKRPLLWQLAASAVSALCVWGVVALLREQAYASGQLGIQAGQMLRRPVLALLLTGLTLSLPFAVRPLRFLMGNRVMTFLAALSMNYYLIHQNLAVHLKRLGIPHSEFTLPNQAGDVTWQYRYTFLCFALSLLAAGVVTFAVEKPCARLLERFFRRRDERRLQLFREQAQTIAAGVSPGETVLLTAPHVPDDLRQAVASAIHGAGGVCLTAPQAPHDRELLLDGRGWRFL